MPQYETSVDIEAPVRLVWAATCDVESWPSWSPTMSSVVRNDSGPIKPGSTAQVHQPKLRAATWTVDDAVEGQNFTWHTDGFGYRVTAAHLFEKQAALGEQSAGTSVRLQLTMTGRLAPLLWALLGRTARGYLDQEAAALKRHCESAS